MRVLFITCMGALSSCGGSDGDITAERRAVDAFIAEFCATTRNCCAVDGIATSGLGTCETQLYQDWEFAWVLQQVANGDTVLDVAALTNCTAQVRAAADSCTLPDVDTCLDSVFDGRREPGSPCDSAIQCRDLTGGVTCFQADGSDVGTCFSEPRGSLGSSCSETCFDSTCRISASSNIDPGTHTFCFVEDGLECDGYPGNCVSVPNSGANCLGGWDCRVSEFCQPSTKVCTAYRTAGQSCDADNLCDDSTECVAGSCVARRWANVDVCAAQFD